METILFVNHKEKQCGVHQFGEQLGKTLEKSTVYKFKYVECSSIEELHSYMFIHMPTKIIYNFYPSTMPWATAAPIMYPFMRHIVIRHEPEPWMSEHNFHAEIFHDPTSPETPGKYKVGRLIKPFETRYKMPIVPTFGTFGFGFGKNYGDVIDAIQMEYDEAIINLHVPPATFGDADGTRANEAAQLAQSKITKPGIQLNVSHDFWSVDQLVDWLAQNTINVFCYLPNIGRGISSTIDYALTARRPIAINRSFQFKHLCSIEHWISLEYQSLHNIIAQGTGPLEQYYTAWSEENMIKSYERIISLV